MVARAPARKSPMARLIPCPALLEGLFHGIFNVDRHAYPHMRTIKRFGALSSLILLLLSACDYSAGFLGKPYAEQYFELSVSAKGDLLGGSFDPSTVWWIRARP
jgi:hypothetical protein